MASVSRGSNPFGTSLGHGSPSGPRSRCLRPLILKHVEEAPFVVLQRVRPCEVKAALTYRPCRVDI